LEYKTVSNFNDNDKIIFSFDLNSNVIFFFIAITFVFVRETVVFQILVGFVHCHVSHCCFVNIVLLKKFSIEMSFKGSFSFKNDKILQLKIDDNIFIRMERVGFAIARLFFVDEGQAEINIPANLVVHDDSHDGAVVLPLFGNQIFVLSWSDSYSVVYNGTSILGLANQRQWAVTGPRAAQVLVFDA
jgi:hypothetical protein